MSRTKSGTMRGQRDVGLGHTPILPETYKVSNADGVMGLSWKVVEWAARMVAQGAIFYSVHH